MKPASFDYVRPGSLEEAVGLLDEHRSDATVLAGGQSLVPLMNLRLARPTLLVDINDLADLRYIRPGADGIEIGALTRHAEVERSKLCRHRLPLASHATSHVGYPAIRHRGTVVGSIAHADPVAEWPCLAVALDASITLRCRGGVRTVPAGDFFTTYFTTTRRPDELVVEVALSDRFDTWGFREFARRRGDFAMAAAAVVLRTVGGEIVETRIALAGAADRPIRIEAAEQVITGRHPSDLNHAATDAGEAAAAVSEPLEDIHGTSDYRRRLVRHVTARAIEDAAARTGSGEAA